MKKRIILIPIFLILVYFAAASFNEYNAQDDPLIASRVFHFNGSGTNLTDSTETYDGGIDDEKNRVTVNIPAWMNGSGVEINGSGLIDSNWNGDVVGSGSACDPFTLFVWLNSTDSGDNSQTIFSATVFAGGDAGIVVEKRHTGEGIDVGVWDGVTHQRSTWRDAEGLPVWTTITSGNNVSIAVQRTSNACDSNDYELYINGTRMTHEVELDTGTLTNNAYADSLYLGNRPDGATAFVARFDDFLILNYSATEQQIIELHAGNSSLLGGGGSPVVSDKFQITATNNYTTSSLNNLTAEILGVGNFSTMNGTITTTLLQNDTSFYTITVSSNDSGSFHQKTYLNVNVSLTLTAVLEPYFDFFNVTYSNNFEYSGLNYTRNISYQYSLTCSNGFNNVSLYFLVNNSKKETTVLTCLNSTIQSFSDTYQHSSEGHVKYSLLLNTSYLPEFNKEYSVNYTFVSDIQNPNITTLNFTIPEGFLNSSTTNVTMICNDNIAPILTYNLSFDNGTFTNLFYGNKTKGTLQENTTDLANGLLNVTATCADFFGQVNGSLGRTVYHKHLILIDERLNVPFDVTNLSSVKAYFDDNSSFYDFKSNNRTDTFFTSSNTNKLRIELTYPSGIVTRYVDTELSDDNLRICANTDDVTHYEQIIIAATQKAVSLTNVFSNCVIAEDYTRFAYQDALMVKAFTIDSLYSLSTISNGMETILASMDGSIATFYNVDILQFNAQAFNVNILGDGLTFKKFDNTTLQIYFQNIFNDSVKTSVSITRMNTSTVVFSDEEITNPNQFYMYFDYSTLDVGENEIFRIDLTLTLEDGTTRVVKRYFNTQGSSGFISTPLVFVIAILITLFGLSFVALAQTFGWFGLIVQIMSIGILSLGTQTWYSLILMGCNVIILIFILLMSVVSRDRGSRLV